MLCHSFRIWIGKKALLGITISPHFLWTCKPQTSTTKDHSLNQYLLQCPFMKHNPEPSPLIVLSLSLFLPYYFSPSLLRPTVSLSFITNSHSLCSDEDRTKGERGGSVAHACASGLPDGKIWSLPFLGLRQGGGCGAQSKERKGSNFAA